MASVLVRVEVNDPQDQDGDRARGVEQRTAARASRDGVCRVAFRRFTIRGAPVSHLSVGPVHHMRMAVTDVQRSRAFYTEVLGFEVAVDAPPPPDDENHEVLVDSLQG